MALTKAPEELLDKSLTSALSITVDDNSAALTLKSTDADANSGPELALTRDSSSPADDDFTGIISFNADDDGGNVTRFALIRSQIKDASDGSEDGSMDIKTMVGGSERSRVVFGSAETNFNEGGVDLDFRVESDSNTHALFVQASDGSVGIGCTPDSTVSVDVQNLSASSNNVFLRIKNSTNLEDSGLIIEGQNGGAREYKIGVNSIANTSDLTFSGPTGYRYYIGSTEALRIDSNRHFLVGTTDDVVQTNSGTGNGGIVLRSNNYVAVASDGSAALELNRLASDGEIANFRKDGTTVGSIASSGGGIHFNGDGLGLRMSGTAITPTDGGTGTEDATNDLGTSAARFKDLYLSGGVFLGGTGSANELDDYEEGNFTGSGTAGSSTALTIDNEKYTKIGNQVTIVFTVNFSGASGGLSVTGLPYAAAEASVGIGREDATSGYAVYGRVGQSSSGISIYYAGATANASPFQVSAGNMRFSMTYLTT